MSFVSIIVPVYNAESSLARCVDSLLKQTYSNFEILLINDGSSDNSVSICKYYSSVDSRVHLFNKKNGGVSSARNYGLKVAKGEWIAFVDSDDWVEPDYLSELIPSDSSELIIGSFYYDGSSTIVNYIKDGVWHTGNIEYVLSNMSFCSPWGKVLSKSIIDSYDLLFDLRVSAGEDMLFMYKYISVMPLHIKTISKPLYHYVVSSTSLSHKIVPIQTSLLVIELLASSVESIEAIYKCNIRDVFNEMLCSQLVNLKRAIMKEQGISTKIIYIRQILSNRYIRLLLINTEYLLHRRRYGIVKRCKIVILTSLMKVYYAIVK